jgi:contact-dependent growth inhibition (CDI) system CdiI-like immunity protein
MSSATRFPAANLLFSGYFHQDFDGTPEEVIAKFVQEQPREQSKQAMSDIEALLEHHSEEESIARIVDGEFGNSFDVLRFKASYRVWLQEVIESIRKKSAERR